MHAAGVYYKGCVASVRQPLAGAAREDERYDPWEAIQVEWDSRGLAGECERVSPWEIERDPDDTAQVEEDRRAEEPQMRTSQREPVPNMR